MAGGKLCAINVTKPRVLVKRGNNDKYWIERQVERPAAAN